MARSIVTCEMVFPYIAGSKVSRRQLVSADLHPGGQENPRQPHVCPSFSIVLGNGQPSERSRSGGCGSDGTFVLCLGFFSLFLQRTLHGNRSVLTAVRCKSVIILSATEKTRLDDSSLRLGW